jgi:hypothetical protein
MNPETTFHNMCWTTVNRVVVMVWPVLGSVRRQRLLGPCPLSSDGLKREENEGLTICWAGLPENILGGLPVVVKVYMTRNIHITLYKNI